MYFLEEVLNTPLRHLLPPIQHRIATATRYFGVQTMKNPLDFWVYQELITDTRPDVIIEIGNYCGGSLLALAHLCDLMGKGRVIGLDVDHTRLSSITRAHNRVQLITGDACESFEEVRASIDECEDVLIIEDSAHTYINTLNILNTFSRLIKPGGYIVVEDSICHHGLQVGPDPGPYEAIQTFVANTSDFIIDRHREAFVITWNPMGFLMRASA